MTFGEDSSDIELLLEDDGVARIAVRNLPGDGQQWRSESGRQAFGGKGSGKQENREKNSGETVHRAGHSFPGRIVPRVERRCEVILGIPDDR